jgi:hypothetical protein
MRGSAILEESEIQHFIESSLGRVPAGTLHRSSLVCSCAFSLIGQGNTLLHIACFDGNVHLAKELIWKGADTFATNVHNMTPFDVATSEVQEQGFLS